MATPVRSGWDYQKTGTTLMAREIIFGIANFGGFLPLLVIAALTMIGSPVHSAYMVIRMIESVNNLSCVLINQCSYSMILQTGEEMDREMTVQIPTMQERMDLFEKFLPDYAFVNPLGGLVFEERMYAFRSNRDSYKAVLNHWNNSWERTKTVVTEVIDGDTIYVAAYDDPVRIEGIDCPEICHPEYDDCDVMDKKWDAGYAARSYAMTLLEEPPVYGEDVGQYKEVYLRVRKQRDFYGRLLAKVRIGEEDGPIFGNEMVKAGHAKFYTWSFPSTLTH